MDGQLTNLARTQPTKRVALVTFNDEVRGGVCVGGEGVCVCVCEGVCVHLRACMHVKGGRCVCVGRGGRG